MKKLFTFVMLAAMVLMASCAKEDKFAEEMANGESVHFTVMSDLATKASFGNAASVDQLLVQVFRDNGDGNYTLLSNVHPTITPVDGATPAAWDVDIKLAKSYDYRIAFWAQKEGTEIYNTDDLSAVSVDYNSIAINSDNADAFCAARFVTVAGPLAETVVLYRPLAQINLGTNDLAEYLDCVLTDDEKALKVAYEFESVPSVLNIIGGDKTGNVVAATTSEPVSVAYPATAVLGNETFTTSDEKTYSYLAMAYVLADKAKDLVEFTATISTPIQTVNTIEVANMPYQANYKTNVFGQLLTGSLHYDVEISPAFFAPDYEKAVAPTFASVEALNEYFAKFEPNDDNGDIDPEEVTLTAVEDGDTIKLPKTAENVVIRVPATCAGSLTIEYADGAEEPAQKPENIDLFLANLGHLELNTPDSHVELLSGSVLGSATVYTNGDTFVIQEGAKVGDLEVKEGNTNVAGEADSITVNSEDKVEVMVQKTAQVGSINLETPADVIVEQPKDNIQNDDTENKVTVNVGENAEGSTATAQNGGAIYVQAAGDCVVANKDEESSAYVASVEEGVTVEAQGDVQSAEGADVVVYVAQIGDVKYASLQAAFDAVPAPEFDGDYTKICVIKDIEASAGVFLKKGNKVIVLDLEDHVVSFAGPAVGSTNTATQGFHLEKGNTVDIKNGTIKLDKGQTAVLMLIQNYCNLTLSNVTVDGTNLPGTGAYVLSNNCGFVLIEGTTSITAKDGDYAFDVCWAPKYYPDGAKVTVNTEGVIKGKIQVDLWGKLDAAVPVASKLEIRKGIFDLQQSDFEYEDVFEDEEMVRIIGGYFKFDPIDLWFFPVPEGYCVGFFAEGPYVGYCQVAPVNGPSGYYNNFDYPVGGFISEPGFW